MTYTERWASGTEKTFVVPCDKLDPSVLTVDCHHGLGEEDIDLECQAAADDIKTSDDDATMMVPICFSDHGVRDEAPKSGF